MHYSHICDEAGVNKSVLPGVQYKNIALAMTEVSYIIYIFVSAQYSVGTQGSKCPMMHLPEHIPIVQ